MKKKWMISALIFLIILFAMPINGTSEQTNSQSDIQVIPDEAIRLRILANSNQTDDQQLKRTIRDEVNAMITDWVKEITDINQARTMINKRIPEINDVVGKVLKRENKEQTFDVKYGSNITFPAKLYGSFLYPAGEYEAVLITLGEGKGDNWWCVLFPPLCFLDFGNGASVAKASTDEQVEQEKEPEEEETEVKFFLFEWFGWS